MILGLFYLSPCPSPSARSLFQERGILSSMFEGETSAQQKRRKLQYARKLRQRTTVAEEILWESLRARRCGGMKFRRQSPISWFVVDFLCVESSLVVEVDGLIHDQQKEYDREREEEIIHLGYKILRFTNDQVIYHLSEVLDTIQKHRRQPPLSG